MLRDRIKTALVLGLLLVAVLFVLPASATVVVITLAILAGAWEWSAFVSPFSRTTRVAFVVAIALGMVSLWFNAPDAERSQVIYGIAILWWLTAFVWVTFAPGRVSRVSAAFAGILTLLPAWLALVHLRLDFVDGERWIFFLLIMVTAADSGAFFVGRRFGRVRLAPHVSPGKTWEGAIGGMLAASCVSIVAAAWFQVPMGLFVTLCVAAAAFSVVGDLTESLLKRSAGLKDSGTLFPGHGGVLDRMDSLTAAAPVLIFGLRSAGIT